MDVWLREGFNVDNRGVTAAAAAEALSAAGGGGGGRWWQARGATGITRYRSRLLPHVEGGDLLEHLAKQDTVRVKSGLGMIGKREGCVGREREGETLELRGEGTFKRTSLDVDHSEPMDSKSKALTWKRGPKIVFVAELQSSLRVLVDDEC